MTRPLSRVVRPASVAVVLALVTSGCTVWGWGPNPLGQADPTTAPASSSTPVPAGTNALVITAGANHTCVLYLDRTVSCHGGNSWGQLGTGDTDAASGHVPIGLDADWRTIDAGAVHACGIKLDDSLWCWGGYPQHLQAPDGSLISPGVPVQVAPGTTFAAVAAGPTSTCAIDTSGALWCWGLNPFGEVGNESSDPVETPLLIDVGPWRSVDVGTAGACGTKTDGTLWCWGAFSSPWREELMPPTQFGDDTTWTTTHTADLHYCALRTDASLWCWGFNFNGQLGVPGDTWYPEPVEVGAGTGWRGVAPGMTHSCAIATDGSLWCWGRNDSGQLGDGTTTDRDDPVLVDDSAFWLDVDVGGAGGHTVGISI